MGNVGYLFGWYWCCFYKGIGLCLYLGGCWFVFFCGVGDFNDGDVVIF